jgi:ribulose-5-phosphate 4-epimerase/fuculose-1-phosphate aldolase
VTTLEGLVDELRQVGADSSARGLVVASGGNLSARLPGDRLVVTARGTWFDRLTPADFSVIGMDGDVLEGNPAPSTEWRLHAQTYLVRPDVNAIVHLHPQTAVVLDAAGHAVRLLTLDHAVYVRRVARVPFLPSGSTELAAAAAEAARDANAILLANHGCSTLGETVEMAFRRALNLEEAARATVLALQLGDTSGTFPVDPADAIHR